MLIDKKQIKGKPRKVATLNGHDVMHTITKGGLHILSSIMGPKSETLGTGPHVGIARHIAMKHHDIQWTSLNKSDWVELEHCQELMPKYENLTTALRKREGSDK